MKLAIFSESSADESAIRILVEALLKKQTEKIDLPLRRREGWSYVFNNISTLIRSLHFNPDIEGLIVVVDSDNTPLHRLEHEQPNASNSKCRVCHLQNCITEVQKTLKPISNRTPLKVAVGLAVPAIEAWYLCGKDAHSTEAMLTQRRDAGTPTLRTELKRRVYNPDVPLLSFRMPPLIFQTQCAVKEAKRLANDIAQLKTFFPNGFGKLVRDISNW